MTRNVEPYDILSEAEAFVNQLESDELEIAPEADNWSAEGSYWKDSKGKKSVANAIAITIADFKKFKDMYVRIRQLSDQGNQIAIAEKPKLSGELLVLAQEIVTAKNLLKTHHLLNPGKKIISELASLKEQLKQEKAAREELQTKYDALDKMYTNLTTKIITEMGAGGQKYIEDAAAFDYTTIESDVEDGDENNRA